MIPRGLLVLALLSPAVAFLAPAQLQGKLSSRVSALNIRAPSLRTCNVAGRAVMKVAALDDSTEWTLAIADGVNARVIFSEDPGYEPPQGRLVIVGESKYLTATGPSCLWKLGEDPAKEGFDKAGFWIWGLFEEPAYPFFFFELDVIQEIPTETGVIPVGKLYGEAQLTRTKEAGVTLSDGKLTVKQYTEYQADLVGLSTATLGSDVVCGSFTARSI